MGSLVISVMLMMDFPPNEPLVLYGQKLKAIQTQLTEYLKNGVLYLIKLKKKILPKTVIQKKKSK